MLDPVIFKNTYLENNQIILRQTIIEDLEDLYGQGGIKEMWEQHSDKTRYKKEEFKKYFLTGLKNDLGCFTIIQKSDDRIVGWTRYYDLDKSNPLVRIGFTFIGQEYWGTGLNLIIKRLMIDYAFNHVEKVSFKVYCKNYRSQKAVMKLGAVFSQTHGDRNEYILLKKNWLKINRAQL